VATNPRYANGHRRRRLRARLLAQGGYCPWPGCPWPDEPFDRTLHYLDDRAPEVDEVVPVSKGGDPLARANTRLLHRWCNQKRSDGTRTPRIVAPASSFPTSTDW